MGLEIENVLIKEFNTLGYCVVFHQSIGEYTCGVNGDDLQRLNFNLFFRLKFTKEYIFLNYFDRNTPLNKKFTSSKKVVDFVLNKFPIHKNEEESKKIIMDENK